MNAPSALRLRARLCQWTFSFSLAHTPLPFVLHMSLNPSNDTTHIGWQSEPNLRGTYTIVSSCVSTLLICVLSAVHLNIPAKGHAGWDQTLRKAKWVCAGMFTPEVLALAAFIQFDAARTMTTKAQHLMKDVYSQPGLTVLEEPADIEVSICSYCSITAF